MRKVVFISHAPLLPRLKDAYLLDQLIDSGYLIEYWNIQSILNNSDKFKDQLNYSYTYKVNSLSEFESKLKNIDFKKTVFIILFENIFPYRSLFNALKRFDSFLIRLNIYPISIGFLINKKNLRVLFSRKGLFVLRRFFLTILYSLFLKIKNEKTFNAYFSCSSFTPRTLKINSLDYENFQKAKLIESRLVNEDFIVFLDIFFPLHPELQAKKNNVDILELTKKYRCSIQNFFDQLEVKFNMPVIIAAHPSSEYKENEFGKRKIIKNQTINLVKDSSLIITHNSVSHVLALLFKKPIIFIQTNGMRQIKEELTDDIFNNVTELAKSLNKTPYNIDQVPFKSIDFTNIDETIRQKYIYSYVTSKETEFKRNEDVILNELNIIFNELSK